MPQIDSDQADYEYSRDSGFLGYECPKCKRLIDVRLAGCPKCGEPKPEVKGTSD